MSLDGRGGEFRLFAPDFPDWIEEKGVGIKLAPDQRTTTIMKTVLNNLEGNKPMLHLFEQLHGEAPIENTVTDAAPLPLAYNNKRLNESQQQAVAAITQNEHITIV